MSTINAILPVIKHAVNDKNFHFQYHVMKTSKDFKPRTVYCWVSRSAPICYQKEDTVVASTTISDH